MKQLNAYLNFQGNCHQAMTYYQECLGGDLSFMFVKDTPMAAEMPEEHQDKITHCSLTIGPLVLMASDILGPQFVKGNDISLCIECSSRQEIETLFANLSAGGHVSSALQQEFWGALFCEFNDKFGINWLLNYPLAPGWQ